MHHYMQRVIQLEAGGLARQVYNEMSDCVGTMCAAETVELGSMGLMDETPRLAG